MKEFTQKDWQEVCQNIKDNIYKFNLSELEEISSVYNLEQEVINEKVIPLEKFIKLTDSQFYPIYNTIGNICCLEHISDATQHWQEELLTAFNELFKPTIKNNISKRKHIITHLIEPVLNPKTFEPEDDAIFIRAMKAEIHKASFSKNQRHIREARFISEHILPNISVFRVANSTRISILFKEVLNAIADNDYDKLVFAVDNFIKTKTDISI